jgi:hypothetical protein
LWGIKLPILRHPLVFTLSPPSPVKAKTLAIPLESWLRGELRGGIGFRTRSVTTLMQILALVLFTYGVIALRLELVG